LEVKMNLFKPSKDYGDVLNKVGWTTFFVVLILTVIIRFNIPPINDVLIGLEGSLTINFLDNVFSPLSLGLPALLAIIARTIKLHDRLSDLLRIRKNFEVNYILKPLCEDLDFNINLKHEKKLFVQRRPLMYKVFYPYATSTEGEQKIDRHMIMMALDQWSFFWFLEEASLFLIISIILHLCFQSWLSGLILVFILIILFFLMRFSYKKSIGYARDQLDMILSDLKRKEEVRRNLHDILYKK
jgi:hypothetical protein